MTDLTPVAKQLIYLLQAALGFCDNIPSPQKDLMPQCYKLACEQGVQAIAWDGLNKLFSNEEISMLLPRQLKLSWALSCEKIEQRYLKQESAIASLAEFYSSYGISMMILKGYGLSLLYPVPKHRPCGDIDIWLYGEQKRADELLSKDKGIKIDNEHHHHTIFHYQGVMVENHYDFLNIHSHLSNRNIEKQLHIFSQEKSEETAVGSQKINLPPSNLNALFLLRHSASHFAAIEIKLRHIIDWALFVKYEGNKVDWQAIEAIAKVQNMDRFLHCINGICIDYFGLDPQIPLQFARDKRLETRILNDIIQAEFSEKSPKDSGFLKLTFYRTRRWWANRWKHRIVYRDSLIGTFLTQIRAHLMKPLSLK